MSTTDRKTQTTTFSYDALNRRTQASYADGAMATFTYDAAGRLTQADDTADPHRPITRTYDPLDRLLTETTTLGTVSYAYDNAGRRTSMTVSGQSPVIYTYDHNSRLRTITQAPLNPVSIDYDALNRRTLLTLPNGVSTEYQYDLASQVTALIYRNAVGLLGDFTYQYDAAGNRISVGGSFARTLLPDAVTTSAYDAGNRQLAFGGSAMTFDLNGNLGTQTDSSGTIGYTWDARDRLASLSGPGVNASFAYDGLGRRARKTISGLLVQFQYDGLDIVREVGAAGDASYLRTLAIDETLTRTDTAGPIAYLADPLGGTVALADGTGNPSIAYTYAPFGETTASGSPSPNPFQFTGRENDGTGLYYYRARYYAPRYGRFIGEDPLTFRGGDTNFFGYAANNPVNLKDPRGLWIPQAIGGVLGLGFGAYSAYASGQGFSGIVQSAAVGGAAGVLSTLPIAGINPLLSGAAMGAFAGFLGNVGTQVLVPNSCSKGIDFRPAGPSALAGAAGGIVGSGLGGITGNQGLPVFTNFGSDVVAASVSGIVAGVVDVLLH